jgi:hypothetical protein
MKLPEVYKDIAEKAAEALQVKITGVDILIEDLNDGFGEKYSIIEANFNPAMLFHLYPFEGERASGNDGCPAFPLPRNLCLINKNPLMSRGFF